MSAATMAAAASSSAPAHCAGTFGGTFGARCPLVLLSFFLPAVFAKLPTLLFAATLLLSGCETKPAATAAPTEAANAAAPAAAAEARYECPMGCAGSQSTAPGKCPTCGMELEKKS